MTGDNSAGDQMIFNQSGFELLDYRIKQLEDERMPHRITLGETLMKQLQDDVREITVTNREYGAKLDSAVKTMADNQLRFITAAKTGFRLSSLVGGGLVAFITFAPAVMRMIAALPGQ